MPFLLLRDVSGIFGNLLFLFVSHELHELHELNEFGLTAGFYLLAMDCTDWIGPHPGPLPGERGKEDFSSKAILLQNILHAYFMHYPCLCYPLSRA